jgi:hypothetical protein
MAKICGVDLQKQSFPLDAIVQTSVARVNALLCDIRLMAYLFSQF